METLAIILGFAILGFLIYRSAKQNKQLTSEGKIIDRERKFMEQAEDFTLACDNPVRVLEKLRQLPCSEMQVSMSADEQRQTFNFTYSNFAGNWNATLYRKDASNGQLTYRFQFINWKMRNGVPVGEVQMNQLLTAIEKMFLSIDPNTKVQNTYLETKTNHKLF